MTKTIDERIVELGFNNKQFQEGTKESLDSIKDLKKGLNFDGATKGLEKIDSSVDKVDFKPMGSAIEDIRSKFSVLGVVAFTIIQDMTRGIINFGQKVADTLVLDPIKMGFSEYETKINAIQTILANTSKAGIKLEDVTGVLDVLNIYADKTIYNFTEMTKNIGTFTAAGIDLDRSAAAIKGIANLAAVSGSNSQQASTAMYQLSQALSSGTLKLQDWNSVVNAGMGGQVFQDALKETAEVHGVAVEQMIEDAGSFRESLSEGWITSDILTETLAKFTGDLTKAELIAIGYAEQQAEEILALGTVANDAATKVKTLTQLGDTLEEAMQSGWTQSWEILIGDFNEAKNLLTEVSDTIGAVIGKSAEARNELLQKWKDMGGRGSLINSLWNAFEALSQVMSTIKGAWQSIFPPIFAEQLLLWTFSLEAFTAKLKMGEKTAGKVGLVFKGFFALLDIGRKIIMGLLGALFNLNGDALGELAEKILTFAAYISLWIIDMRNGLDVTSALREGLEKLTNALDPYIEKIGAFVERVKEKLAYFGAFSWIFLKLFVQEFLDTFEPIEKVTEFFEALRTKVAEIIGKIIPKFKQFTDKVGPTISDFLSNITGSIENFDTDKLFDLIGKGLLGTLIAAVTAFIAKGRDVFGGLEEVLEGVGDVLTAWQRDLQSKVLLRIAGAIAVLAVAMLILATIPGDKLTVALTGITVMMVELFAAMKAFAGVSASSTSLLKLSGTLVVMGLAMLTIAGVVTKLARLDAESMTRGIMGLAAILALAKGTATSLSKNTKDFIKAASALRVLAGALLIMTASIFILGKMDPEAVTQGVLAVGAMLGELLAFVRLSGGGKGMLEIGVGLTIVAASLYLFIGAIALLGVIPMEVAQAGILALGAALLVLIGALHLMPKEGQLLAAAVSIAVISASLVLISGVILALGSLKAATLAQGILGILGVLAALAVGMQLAQGSVGGAIALFIVSQSLIALAGALTLIGQLEWEQLKTGLIGIAAVIGILAIAGYLLAPLSVPLLLLGVALMTIGAAAFFFGKAMFLLATALSILAVAGVAGIYVLILAISEIGALLPQVAKDIGNALVNLLMTIVGRAPELLDALVTLLLVLIDAIVEVIPPLVDAILLLIQTLLDKLVEKLPDIIQAGYDILIAILTGFRDNIGEVVTLGYDIVIELLNAMGEKIPDLVDAGWNMMINIIDGIADSAEENIPRMMKAVEDLGAAIINGILTGLTTSDGSVFNAIWDLGEGIISNFKQVLGIESPSKEFIGATGNIIDGVVVGVKKFSRKALMAAGNFAKSVVDKFSTVSGEMSKAIETDIDASPVVTPVMDLSAFQAGTDDMGKIISDQDLAATIDSANIVAAKIKESSLASQVDDKLPDGSTQAPINYIQNNYSPKALSPIEVYRQTRNQLRQLKGATP